MADYRYKLLIQLQRYNLKTNLIYTMKAKHYAGACAILAAVLSSCSSDMEPSGEYYNPSEIKFNVIADRSTRGEVTTTANIQEFAVTAYTEGKILMNNVLVKRTGSEWTYSPKAYWPDTPVNFYAVSPNPSDSIGITGASTGTASINGFKNPGDIDLLYAVNYGDIQSGSPVTINFRHALSKVNVMLSSANKAITVKINKVTIGNTATTGSFFYPRSTTSAGSDVVGSWHSQSGISEVTLFASAGSTGNYTLTADPTDPVGLNSADGYEFFIPQELSKLSYDSANKQITGSYIAVDCAIYDTATGGKLFPNNQTPSYLIAENTTYGRILYPVTNSTVTAWKQGYSYVYNIAIDNPSVLFDGIEFAVAVDAYQNEGMTEYPGM